MENCKLMRRPDVEAMTGLKRSSLYAMMDRGAFPKPIKLSVRSVGWRENEVVAWVNSRIAATREGGAQ